MRERRLAVSVVALTAVATLRVPPQKLLTGLDALTLLLLGRLQKQQDPEQQQLIQVVMMCCSAAYCCGKQDM
jgi:hypothetical protein